MGPEIVVSQVSVSFGSVLALPTITMHVRPGEMVALVGPSGSGKSTLLGCVTGTVKPTTGSVDVGDVTVTELSSSGRSGFRRSRIGVVFQNPDLLPELLVWENVALIMLFDGVRREDARARALEALEHLDIASQAHKRVDELSGGEAQRVALARALVRDGADVLVADEPTASLDAGNAAHVVHLLRERAHDLGVTGIVATHDPRVADAMDRTIDLTKAPEPV